MCVGVSLCVGGLVGGLVWGAGGDWLLSKKWQLCWVYLLCGLAQVVYHTWAKQLSASTTLPPSFKTDPQKKLTVPFFLVVTSIIKTIICIFFILLEFSRRDTIQHKTFSWKFLFSYYCKSILYLFFFGKDEKFVRHCQKSFNRQTCTTGSAASGGREGINLGQAWVKM